jgi:very-short-patch-repair endonuclease
LWHEFLNALPQKFTRQKPLGQYIADFYCARHNLVIEVDGDSHYTDRGERYDAERTGWLAARGITVLRFTNTQVLQEFESVCAAVLSALGET